MTDVPAAWRQLIEAIAALWSELLEAGCTAAYAIPVLAPFARRIGSTLGWAVIHTDVAVVITPRADWFTHDLLDDCCCGPAIDYDMPDGPLVRHHALDGRD